MATFGKTTVGSSTSSSSANRIWVSTATPSETGTVQTGTARVWLSATGTAATKMAIYADSGGEPGVLLAESDIVTLDSEAGGTVEDWRTYTFSSPIQVTASTAYWIAVAWQDPGTASVTVSRDGDAAGRREQVISAWPDLPDPYGTPSDPDNTGPIAAYITYSTGTNAAAGHAAGTGAAAAVQMKAGPTIRRYFSNAAAAQTPSITGSWEKTSDAVVRHLSATPSGAATSVASSETSTSTTFDVLLGRWVSDQITTAGTLAGAYQFVRGILESDAAADFRTLAVVSVYASDGTTLRGTAVDVLGSSEWPATTATAISFSGSLAAVECQVGDRIVVELGYRATNAAATSYTGTLYYGGTATPDLAHAGTDMTLPGWIDLPAGHLFGAATDADAELATGTGTAHTAAANTDDGGLPAGIRARLAGGNTTAATSHVVTLPGSALSGDQVFVSFVNDHATTTAAPSAGWEQLGTTGQGTSTNHRLTVFSRVLDGSGSDALTVTLTDGGHGNTVEAAWSIVVQEGDGGAPTLLFADGGNATAGAIAAITGLASDTYISIVFLGLDNSSGSTQTITPPAGGYADTLTGPGNGNDVLSWSMDVAAETTGFSPTGLEWTGADQWITAHLVVAAAATIDPGADPDAPAATGTGAALQPTATSNAAAPAAGHASGTGTARQATAANAADTTSHAGHATGTGAAHAPADVDPDDGGAPLPANPGEALWIGPTAGKNHFNIGIGVATAQGGGGPEDHIDTDEDEIAAGFSQDPEFKLTEDRSAVHFQIGVDAGRTSENTSYPRSELRELDESGENADWNGSTGVHYMRGRSRITHTAATKPWVVFFQIHDAESDLIRVQTESGGSGPTGLRIRARRTPPGGGTEVTTTLLSSYTVGDWIDWEVRVGGGAPGDDPEVNNNGRLRVWLNGVLVLNVAGGGATTGCYFKAGAYAQSNTSTENGDDTQFFSVEIAAGSFECWHTGYAAPTTPVYTGPASDLVTHTLYLTSTPSSHTPNAVQSFWTANAPAGSTPLLLGATPSGAPTTTALAETSTINPYYGLIRQFVTHPVSEGGTLTGVYRLVAGVAESDAAADMVLTVAVWVTQGDTPAARGTALAAFAAVEWPTVATGRALGEPTAVTNDVVFQAGDRFVVEVGYRATNAVTTSYTGTLHHGGTSPIPLEIGGTDFSRPGSITLQVSGASDLEFVDPGNNAAAGLAIGSGSAEDPTLETDNAPGIGAGAGTGAALDPTLNLSASADAPVATGTGAAHAPGVSSDGNLSIAAEVATGAGAALDPSPTGTITPEAGHAAGTGAALQALRGVNAAAELATGTGVAQEADPAPNAQPDAGHATGTGQARTPGTTNEDPIGTPILRNQFPDLDRWLVVEVAWGADLTEDGSNWAWTDVTQDVRQSAGLSLSGGRSDEASTTQPAECTLILDNREGLYSIGGQSPNWPYVRRNTPIRVLFDPGTEVYQTMFVGYATSWTPTWDSTGRNAQVQLSAHGALRRLEQRTAPVISSIRRAYLAADNVIAYWPCEEPAGAQAIASALPDQPPITIRGDAEQPFPKFAQNEDFACSLPLPEVALTAWQAAVPPYVDTGEFQVRWLMVAPTDPLNGTECVLLRVTTTGTVAQWDVIYANGFGGQATVRGYTTNGTLVVNEPLAAFNVDNTVRRWSFELRQAGSNIEYELRSLGLGYTGAGSLLGTPSVAGQTLGDIQSVTVCPDKDFDDVAIGHILVQSAITDGVTEKAQFEANTGELVTDRIARLCAENNVPVTIIGTSAVLMGEQSAGDLITLLRECEAADQGLLVDGLHSGLTYICRSEREARTPDLILDAAAGHTAREIAPVDDDQRTLNKATAQRLRGAEVTVEDIDGPMGTAAIGDYDDSVKVASYEDKDIGDYASWLVNLGTVEGYRWPKVHLDLAHKPELIDQWLAVLPSSRVDITNLSDIRDQLPPGTVQLLVEGYTQTISQVTWDVELTCSSYEPWRLGQIAEETGDTNEYVLRAISDGSTLDAPAVAGATSLAVTTPSGPRWTTAIDDFPMDISVGGIRVTVTAITGTGTTQTFTVDPDTVTKAFPAGLDVTLWRPTVIGL